MASHNLKYKYKDIYSNRKEINGNCREKKKHHNTICRTGMNIRQVAFWEADSLLVDVSIQSELVETLAEVLVEVLMEVKMLVEVLVLVGGLGFWWRWSCWWRCWCRWRWRGQSPLPTDMSLLEDCLSVGRCEPARVV